MPVPEIQVPGSAGVRRGTRRRVAGPDGTAVRVAGACGVLVTALALAGCGGGDDDPPPTSSLPPIGPTTTTVTPAVAVSTTTIPTASTGAGGTYTVVANDTLSGIADRFGVSLDALATANGFDPNDQESMARLQVGQVLTIPASDTPVATTATTAPAAPPVDPAASTTTAPVAGP